MHSPRERRSPPTIAENGHADPGKCGASVGKEKNGRHLRSGGTKNSQDMMFHVGRQLVGHVSFEGQPGTDDEGSD